MVDRQETRATVCDECGSGLLDGDHIADYACSKRSRQETREAREALVRDAKSARCHNIDCVCNDTKADAAVDRLAAEVDKLTEALRGYHDLAPALAECANDCGASVLYSDLHRANQAAEAALASGVPADEETT